MLFLVRYELKPLSRAAGASHDRRDWMPIQGAPLIKGRCDGDDEIRRVQETVGAAVIPR